MANSDTPNPEAPQTVRTSFGEQLNELRTDMITLASLTSESVRAATKCIVDKNVDGVDNVIKNYERIDEIRETTEKKVYEFLAIQQPMAGDLRALITVLHILNEIQLSADLAVNIAKASRRLFPSELSLNFRRIIGLMGSQAVVQFEVAIDSFSDSNAEVAGALPDMNTVMDDLQKDLFRQVFSEPMAAEKDNPEQNLRFAVQLALLGRYYERIADHTVLMGAWTRFMITGEFPSRR